MNLTILTDNYSLPGKPLLAEHGLSFYIETDGKKILFDTGYSDVFMRNAVKLDLSLRHLDYLVFSHGHYDHTWGVVPLIALYRESIKNKIPYHKPEVITHPLTFYHKYKEPFGEQGSLLSESRLASIFQLSLRKTPFWITEKLVFLGEVPRTNDFEGNYSDGKIYKNKIYIDDCILEDSALAYKTDAGLVVITGCAHSGICNTIAYAQSICAETRILDVVGGLHLCEAAETQVQSTVQYLKKVSPLSIHPCHCTGFAARMAFVNTLPLQETGVGLTLNYSE
ncbi:MAG: MBL fold metallo-hydrolase [Candidatus Margulisiibacteriota bacterium]|nr:MAG: MBL fold metallo-hydrolase [Candidatus Margulisiibacteriota bacterium]HCY37311.1 MBL fold metallo-hydrolase [Candidatus Margulisiibacteriota bacterium]